MMLLYKFPKYVKLTICNITVKKSKRILGPRAEADGFLRIAVRWRSSGRYNPRGASNVLSLKLREGRVWT